MIVIVIVIVIFDDADLARRPRGVRVLPRAAPPGSGVAVLELAGYHGYFQIERRPDAPEGRTHFTER